VLTLLRFYPTEDFPWEPDTFISINDRPQRKYVKPPGN
jgi:hypothetical protein